MTEAITPLRKLAPSDQMFALMVASVRDYAIFLLDPSGHVATWNAGAERIKGYRADEIIGRHFSTFYPLDDVEAGKCEMELAAAAADGRFEDEGWRVRKDGTRFWANVVITAIRDATGTLIGFGKVTRDLTERKRAEDDRAARRAAEEANRAKDEFLAMLGHELRNPLAPIVTALQLLKLRADAQISREHQVIERQVQHLTHLVDDLLDVSRVSRGKLELKRKVFDVRDSISRALEIASPLVEQKHHALDVRVPPRPLFVDGDPARLTQVFANLLTNAAKYTEEAGHIQLVVRQTATDIVVEVCDDGVGIDDELMPRIFDLFVQGPQSPDRAQGGLGLGLSLVRSLVRMHGGTVEACSDGPKRGSTFVVRLPSAAAPAQPDAGPLATAYKNKTAKRSIVIVDDNEDARMLLADILGALGHEVRTAADGDEALRVLAERTADVAILDIGLPGMDGFELATRVRANPATASTKLIALSGYGQPSDRARASSAGFDRHLVKPVDVRKLIEEL